MSKVVVGLAIVVVLVWLGWLFTKSRSRQRKNEFLKDHGGKACPQCKQYVSQVALVCRSCGYRFDLSEPGVSKDEPHV